MIKVDDKKFIQNISKYFRHIKNTEARVILENSQKME